MLDDIVQCLLCNAVENFLGLQWRLGLATQFSLHAYSVPGLDRSRLLLQRRPEPFIFEGPGPEFEDEGAHLGHARFVQARCILQRLGGACRVATQQLAGGLDA